MTYGRYRPGTTLAHRLDPRVKAAFVLALVVATFAASGWAGVAVCALAAAAALAASGVSAGEALRTLRPFAWLMAFVLVFNAAFASAGLEYGLLCVVRFAVVVLGTSSLMVATAPGELADAANLVLRPLSRLGLRTERAGLAVGMTLRFVPVVMDELERVRRAQEGRFAPLAGRGVAGRVRAVVPLAVPVFVSALRRSRHLALAIENRGFCETPAGGRTHLRSYRLAPVDVLVLALAAALVVAAVLL